MKNLTTLIVIICLIFSCKSPEKTENQKELDKLEISIDSLFNLHIKNNEPGAAVMISYNGKMIIGKGYGLRNINSQEPITKNTNMRMASVSKQFTALTLLRLIDQNKLSLQDSVYNILPIETFKGVTIEQLINHTSGQADAEEIFFTEWDSTKIATNKDILKWYSIKNRKVANPGEKYRYNNGIYEFIPAIVEKVSGKKFSTFAKEEIFEKAGMKNTQYFNLAEPTKIKERAFCYERDSLGRWKKVDGHYLNGLLGAGGIYTSVNDYFQYDQTLRNKTLFSEEIHELIFKPSSSRIEDGKTKYYAMGWEIKDSIAEHTGGWMGTNTITIRHLKKPLTIAIFMNRNTLFQNNFIEKTESLVYNYIKTIANSD